MPHSGTRHGPQQQHLTHPIVDRPTRASNEGVPRVAPLLCLRVCHTPPPLSTTTSSSAVCNDVINDSNNDVIIVTAAKK